MSARIVPFLGRQSLALFDGKAALNHDPDEYVSMLT